MRIGDKFYHSGGCTILTEDNLDGLIRQTCLELARERSNGANLVMIAHLRSEIDILEKCKLAIPNKQQKLF